MMQLSCGLRSGFSVSVLKYKEEKKTNTIMIHLHSCIKV